MDFDFMLYAAEQEGDIPTKTGKINKLIRLLKEDESDVINTNLFLDKLAESGLTPIDLTSEDFEYIRRKVEE